MPRTWRRKPCYGCGRTRRAGSRWRLFRTWLTRVVVNLCLDRKRRAPWVALEAAGEIVDPAPGAGEKAERDERERLVAAAIAELPARQRAAIVLTYGDGMSNAQVADILGTSVSAVETLAGARQAEPAPRARQRDR